ncbi:MAG: GNAT family N-acetyltransferase [Chloroflexi bacterium]|nr:GNAT family N-acetyltransferase [Chloroflexota bacterium]
MSYTITQESFDSLTSCWADSNHHLRWSSVFVLPVWLQTWWQKFRAGDELYLTGVRQDEMLIGIAPLMVKGEKASLLGSVDVCDYLDFVVVPGMERDFFSTLLDDLKQKGINYLDLRPLRPDATVLTHLVDIAQSRGYEVLCQPEDVSAELDLPASWEEYLAILNTKQRHEVRRKLRRLSQAGKVDCYFVKGSAAVHQAMDTFLKMFTESRSDKATFLTTQMESFFRSMADTMAEAGLLKLGVLDLDTLPVAMIMCFDYDNCLYLYNSSYDIKYDSLSVGLLCKVLSIKESIEEGKKRFDFLKGDEIYKYHLGGKEVPLSRCQITIK